jgi:hypothetical protein
VGLGVEVAVSKNWAGEWGARRQGNGWAVVGLDLRGWAGGGETLEAIRWKPSILHIA